MVQLYAQYLYIGLFIDRPALNLFFHTTILPQYGRVDLLFFGGAVHEQLKGVIPKHDNRH